MEQTLFSRINQIMQEQSEASQRCHDIILLVITFVERNPGFARLFAGDALQGETERLRNRMCQLLDRIETQLRQILREHRAQLPELPSYQVNPTAKLMLAVAKGRIQQFVLGFSSIAQQRLARAVGFVEPGLLFELVRTATACHDQALRSRANLFGNTVVDSPPYVVAMLNRSRRLSAQ